MRTSCGFGDSQSEAVSFPQHGTPVLLFHRRHVHIHGYRPLLDHHFLFCDWFAIIFSFWTICCYILLCRVLFCEITHDMFTYTSLCIISNRKVLFAAVVKWASLTSSKNIWSILLDLGYVQMLIYAPCQSCIHPSLKPPKLVIFVSYWV